ncbi:MAG: hypothetical protein Q8Q88_09390, partial [Phenylobacterium sp.]|nr:hypothetical protein [Phenylobacterium sp.]
MGETLDTESPVEAAFAPQAVDISYRADGSMVLRSPIPLGEYHRHCCEFFLPWVAEAPERTFLGQRGPDDAWRRVNYRDAWARIRAIAQA